MKLIKTPMRRRQFLVTAGATSTSALLLEKLGRRLAPGFQTGIAAASETTGRDDEKGAFSSRYHHLLSPTLRNSGTNQS